MIADGMLEDGTYIAVDLGESRDGGGESSNGDDGELHFCGWLFGWVGWLVKRVDGWS